MDLRDRPTENAAVTGRLNLAFPTLRGKNPQSNDRSLSGSDIPQSALTTSAGLPTPATMTPNSLGASLPPPASIQGLFQNPAFHGALQTSLASFDNMHSQILKEVPQGHNPPLQETYMRARQAMADYWVQQYHLAGKLPSVQDPGRAPQFQFEPATRLPPVLPDNRTSSAETHHLPPTADIRKPQYQLRAEEQAHAVVAAVWNTYSEIGVGSLDVHEEETESVWDVTFRLYKNEDTPRWKPEEMSGWRPVL